MIPSVVEIASPGLYLSKSRGFLIVRNGENPPNKIPLDDIGVLIITSPQATLSTALMNTLAERGIVALLCDTKHRPASYIYPYQSHEELTGRLFDQIKVGKPLKKRIWQKIVKNKIVNQAMILEVLEKEHTQRLRKLASEVTSGDKENREAQAARVYWQALFGPDFRRKPRGGGLNSLLDFGYGILRSAVLRAIAGSGLNPSLGLEHNSRRNPFCLADDLMEPFRPVVDYAVYIFRHEEITEINPQVKRRLAALLSVSILVDRGVTPLARGMSDMTYSLVRSYSRMNNLIEIPKYRESFPEDVEKSWNTMD